MCINISLLCKRKVYECLFKVEWRVEWIDVSSIQYYASHWNRYNTINLHTNICIYVGIKVQNILHSFFFLIQIRLYHTSAWVSGLWISLPLWQVNTSLIEYLIISTQHLLWYSLVRLFWHSIKCVQMFRPRLP